MAQLEIRIYPDPVLREKCVPVSDFDSELGQLLDNMAETMYAAPGIGLAAPQVGKTIRAVIVDVGENGDGLIELVNPEIVSQKGRTSSEEGCLSIPDYRDSVSRSSTIEVRAFDRRGEPFELQADGLLSICIQHELDHLDGVLFIDKMSRLKRELFKRWHKKHANGDSNS